jgi:pimeloyl-ACP methyl ester carboxylesterase
MARAKVNGIEIEYESRGDAAAPTILLINGLGSQMTRYPPAFCDLLAARGFQVIRFDNRDVGLSSKFDGVKVPPLAEIAAARAKGGKPDVPYTLDDMAGDAIGVLDAAGIAKAHVVGISMGGMIGQLVAASYPQRVLSFTSIMSTTGNPSLPPAKPAAMAVLTAPAPDPNADLEAFIAHGIANARTIGSPGYPFEEAVLRERVVSDMRRSYNPAGVGRQMAAVTATGDRRERIGAISAPVVVLHGADDPLVPLAGGQDTAASIPGAELRVIPGMGHDMPPSLYATFIDAILRAVERASVKV